MPQKTQSQTKESLATELTEATEKGNLERQRGRLSWPHDYLTMQRIKTRKAMFSHRGHRERINQEKGFLSLMILQDFSDKTKALFIMSNREGIVRQKKERFGPKIFSVNSVISVPSVAKEGFCSGFSLS